MPKVTLNIKLSSEEFRKLVDGTGIDKMFDSMVNTMTRISALSKEEASSIIAGELMKNDKVKLIVLAKLEGIK